MEFFPHNPTDRFNRLIDELCRVLTRHGAARFIEPPMLLLIWNRITRIGRLFANLVELVRTDRHANPARARSRSAPTRPAASPEPSRVAPSAVLPQHRRWLVNLLPEAEPLGADLCWLLDQPEMRELIAEAPQVGRLLRPLCRMLGVEPPPLLRMPRQPRVRTPRRQTFRAGEGARRFKWTPRRGCWSQ